MDPLCSPRLCNNGYVQAQNKARVCRRIQPRLAVITNYLCPKDYPCSDLLLSDWGKFLGFTHSKQCFAVFLEESEINAPCYLNSRLYSSTQQSSIELRMFFLILYSFGVLQAPMMKMQNI